MKSSRRRLIFAFVASLVASFTVTLAKAQPTLVQVPTTSLAWGVPGTTYSGAVANTSCTSSTPGYLDSLGNGCPATQQAIQYVYSIAVDASGDLAGSFSANYGTRVVYNGGSNMAKMIVGALPGFNFTPIVGHAYILTEGGSSSQLTLTNGQYYCSNTTADGVALDSLGDGCPGRYANTHAFYVTFDPDGNLFIGGVSPAAALRVIYAGGVRAANLINAYNPAVAAAGGPKPGYIYRLSNYATGSTDFVTIGGIAIQVVSATQENIYVADRGTGATETGLLSTTSGNQIKELVCPAGTAGCNTTVNGSTFPAVGWVTYLAGTTTKGTEGDGGPISAAQAFSPYNVLFDTGGDLFYADNGSGRIRVIYNGGTTLPLYSNNTLVTNPVIGNIYTVAGGGTGKTSPASAITLAATPTTYGLDPNGNLYFANSAGPILWSESATTGQAVAIGWTGVSALTDSANLNPQVGAYCNGLSSGPTMTDVYADGCPATEVAPAHLGPSLIPFDAQGNFYIPDQRSSGVASAAVFKYSFGNQFGSVGVSSSATQTLAFTPSTTSATATPTLPPTYSSTEFTDAGGDVCATGTIGTPTQTCTINVSFKPVLAGARTGSVASAQSGTTLITSLLSGAGTGAQISVDPAAITTLGSAIRPGGVALDSSGNVYISSGGSTGVVLKSIAGATPVPFASGFNTPGQLGTDGASNVYVADSGNNRIALISPTGAVSSFLAGTFSVTSGTPVPASTLTGQSLNGPRGVAVDASGNVYIADTGNARVLKVSVAVNGLASQVQALNFTGLNTPQGIAVDASGDVFVADPANHQVVELSAGAVQSVISAFYSPSLASPVGVAVDAASDLYVADSTNQNIVVLATGSTASTPLLSNVAGLTGIAADNAGNLYAASSTAGNVSVLNRTNASYAFTGDLAVGAFSSPVSFTLTNTGNQGLVLSSPLVSSTDANDFLVQGGSGSSGCTVGSTFTPGGSCLLSAVFQPQSVTRAATVVSFPASTAVNNPSLSLGGMADQIALTYKPLSPGAISGTLNVNLLATLSLAQNSTLAGTVSFVIDRGAPITAQVTNGTASTTTALTAGSHTVTATYNGGDSTTITFTIVSGISVQTLTSAPSAPTFGQPVVVTAATSTSNAQQTPTGTITFTVNGVAQPPIGYAPTVNLTLNALPVGKSSIQASYSGDSNYSPASSTVVVTVAQAPTATTLVVTPSATAQGNKIVLSAIVAPIFATAPTGSISFSYGSTILGSVALNNGTATFTTTTNQLSSYSFTATYNGDPNYLGSTKTVVPATTFIEALTPSTLSVPQNAVGVANLQLNPFFGYAGMVTIACTGLPANTVCNTLPPGAVALTATANQSVQLQIQTNAPPLAVHSSSLGGNGNGRVLWLSAGSTVSLCLLMPFWRRRRRFAQACAFVVMLGIALGLAGCGSNTFNTTVYQTPAGTYNIGVTATDGSVASTQTLILTVVPSTNDARPN